MFKEALESLFHYNFKSQEARILRIPGEERLLYIDQNGELTPATIPPAMRRSTVDSIDDLCAAAKCYAEDKFSFWMLEHATAPGVGFDLAAVQARFEAAKTFTEIGQIATDSSGASFG